MFWRNNEQDIRRPVVMRRRSIASERRAAAVIEEHVAVLPRETHIGKKHILVVSLKKYHFFAARSLPVDKIGDHALRVRATIDVITQKHEAIRWFERQTIEEKRQFVEAAVNIAYDVGAHYSYGRVGLRLVQDSVSRQAGVPNYKLTFGTFGSILTLSR